MYPTYSPRGDRIAFTYVPGPRTGSETGELWTISSSGGGARRLATQVDPYAYETGIGWSADGASIVFVDASTPASNPDFNAFDTSVASVFASGGPVFILAGPYPGSASNAALR
jgi:tricorn protease-like protein